MGLYYRLILPSCCDMPGSVRGVSCATRARHFVALFIHQGAALVWRFLVCCGSCVVEWYNAAVAACRGARLGLRGVLMCAGVPRSASAARPSWCAVAAELESTKTCNAATQK